MSSTAAEAAMALAAPTSAWASALGASDGGVAGDEVTDGTGIEQGTDHLVIGEAILLLERHKDAGNDTGAARQWERRQ